LRNHERRNGELGSYHFRQHDWNWRYRNDCSLPSYFDDESGNDESGYDAERFSELDDQHHDASADSEHYDWNDGYDSTSVTRITLS
jgi:hypothetical protein